MNISAIRVRPFPESRDYVFGTIEGLDGLPTTDAVGTEVVRYMKAWRMVVLTYRPPVCIPSTTKI